MLRKCGKEAAEGVGAKALAGSGASAPAHPGADETQGGPKSKPPEGVAGGAIRRAERRAERARFPLLSTGLRGGERLVRSLSQLMGRTSRVATLQAQTWPRVVGGEGCRMEIGGELSRETAHWAMENRTGDCPKWAMSTSELEVRLFAARAAGLARQLATTGAGRGRATSRDEVRGRVGT